MQSPKTKNIAAEDVGGNSKALNMLLKDSPPRIDQDLRKSWPLSRGTGNNCPHNGTSEISVQRVDRVNMQNRRQPKNLSIEERDV